MRVWVLGLGVSVGASVGVYGCVVQLVISVLHAHSCTLFLFLLHIHRYNKHKHNRYNTHLLHVHMYNKHGLVYICMCNHMYV